MTITEQPALPVLRQPAPETIASGEQALSTIFLDPSPEVPETSYALGYLDGCIAGHMYSANVTFVVSAHASTHEQVYETFLRPLPLPAALTRHRDVHDLYVVGWLTGWRDSTTGARGALECVVCARRLFADVDSVHRCRVDGVVACRRGSCDDDYCRADGPELVQHLVECFDEIPEPTAQDACTAAVSS